VRIIGQFHDEIVVDWWPDKDGVSLKKLIAIMESVMGPELHGSWPMEAEVNYAYRYLK
jgi:DNA polymerase I-like protein with 3'-5' exonuclease and polymerase domains